MACYESGDFVEYWEQNMRQLGMWVPVSTYETAGGITGLITAVATVVETNPGASLMQALVRAKISVIGTNVLALSAAGWAGAAIGSAAVALGRSLACGTAIADALWVAREQFSVSGAWLEAEFIRNPHFLEGR
ncbi:MAG: hypothetical protein CML06_05850 [Pseudomonadales bacterium]|nr:hypothetical protein [Pseudomonadales bacterium]